MARPRHHVLEGAGPLFAANWSPVAAGRQGGALRRHWPGVSGGLSLGRPARRASGHTPRVGPHAARDTTKVGSHGRQTGSWLRHLLQLRIVQLAVTVTSGLPSRHSVMASPAQTRRPLTRKLAPATKTGKSGAGGLGGAGVGAWPVIQAARDDIAAAAAHQELGRDHDRAITVTSMNGGQ